MLRYFDLQWKTMQCVVYWNGNILFFTLCPLWNDISWWRNIQDPEPESEWFPQSWWMVDPSFLFCSLVTIGLSRDTWPKLEVLFCYHSAGKMMGSFLSTAACTPAAGGARPRAGGSLLHSGAASGSPEHYSTVQCSTVQHFDFLYSTFLWISAEYEHEYS